MPLIGILSISIITLLLFGLISFSFLLLIKPLTGKSSIFNILLFFSGCFEDGKLFFSFS